MNKNQIALGIGIGLGAMALWAIIELMPLIILAGSGFMILQGLSNIRGLQEHE